MNSDFLSAIGAHAYGCWARALAIAYCARTSDKTQNACVVGYQQGVCSVFVSGLPLLKATASCSLQHIACVSIEVSMVQSLQVVLSRLGRCDGIPSGVHILFQVDPLPV